MSRQRIMSGMRPTGQLHLGHYMGVLKNWVALQHEFECYFMVADWHALTTKYAETDQLAEYRINMVADWLAAGIDPDETTIYVQSAVPEIAELSLLLSMLVPTPWVEGDPTLKDMVKDPNADIHMGLLSYPILQTADILAMGGQKVPVGKDQLAHLEISRKIAKRFNHTYKTDLFPEPQPLLTDTPLLMGLDGNKMGKSNNNGILLSDTEKATQKKINKAITDRGRIQREDPGTPEHCEVVFPYYKLFAGEETQASVAQECRQAKRGCGDCKKQLAVTINGLLAPMRERREQFSHDDIKQIIEAGNAKARQQAGQMLSQVRQAMQIA
jgi:tryptophanyl-tRNA synthetase